MSSAGNSGGGGGEGGGGAAAPQQYFCYQCERQVTIAPPPSPTDELVCPNCQGGFLEEFDSAPPSNPETVIPNPFFTDNFPGTASFGGLPIIFSSSAGATPHPGASPFSVSSAGGGSGIDDLSPLFGTRSPNEFNPFAFLNNYINNLQSRGANIQLVFESPGGGGMGGGGADFRFPANLGDYFIGPGLEQLIQQLAENDPNRYGAPPASKSAVEGLPDIKITDEMLASDSSQCAVCKDSFELNEEAKQMPCKHIYHKDCILPWLEMHNSCPVCRYELPTDDPDYESRRTGQGNDNGRRNNENNAFGLGSGGGGQESIANSPQTPRTVERRLRISLPWLLRGFGETSNSGGGAGNNDGGNNNSSNNNNNNSSNNNNNSDSGASNTGSGRRGGQPREEDLD